MSEEEDEKKGIRLGSLKWKKSEGFIDEESDVVHVQTIGERGVHLNFGAFEYEGLKGKNGEIHPIEPHIRYVARVRMDMEHFKDFAKMVKKHLKKIEEGKVKTTVMKGQEEE